MEMDKGKLFIGGISWDTDENRLKEYFGGFGNVVEAVIMRDRTTGRARGFGFVIFSDPLVAEKVVNEKHVINGRTVEAKKAVPRDDLQLTNRNINNSIAQGSPGPMRTEKIFVGGLASTVTESDFKNYFEQFGDITAVDKVLLRKTFHELDGKMVEVKGAAPKELSAGPTRIPFIGYGYGIGRSNTILNNNYGQGYNLSSQGNYGMRMDGRYNELANTRANFSPFNSRSYTHLEQGLKPGFNGGNDYSGSVGYRHVLGSNKSPFGNPIDYNANSNSRGDSFFNIPSKNGWGNGRINGNSSNKTDSESYFGAFGYNGINWGASSIENSLGYRSGEINTIGLGKFGRNNRLSPASSSSVSSQIGDYEGSYDSFYRGGSLYGDPTWQNASNEFESTSFFGHGLADTVDVRVTKSQDYTLGSRVVSKII